MKTQLHEAFVYIWICKETSRVYIGKHKGHPDDGYICSSKSDQFWNDFNNSDYTWTRKIVFCGTNEEAIEEETKLLQLGGMFRYEYLYNNNAAGAIVHTPEVRAKMSKSLKGRDCYWLRGVKMSDETKAKLSKAKTGKKMTPEQCAANSAANKGRKLTEEHKRNISKGLIGKFASLEARANMSKARKGMIRGPQSPEHKYKRELSRRLTSYRKFYLVDETKRHPWPNAKSKFWKPLQGGDVSRTK